MREKQKIVLTDDQGLYSMVATLNQKAREIGHGEIEFSKGKILIHRGRVVDIRMYTPNVDCYHWRNTKDGT